jgi:RNA polymerase sigma-70 factor (ECF subfamily)
LAVIDAHEADRLALRARAGDTDALARLYRAFAPAVRAYLRRLTGDHAAADDVLHETFLHLMEGRGRFRATGRFRSWLFAVAANSARDHRRRLGSRRQPAAGLAGVGARTPAPPDEAVAVRETLRLVERALDDLPPEYGAAFHLRVREGLSYREIAAVTGDPEGTLRSRVYHTLQRLRKRLAAAGMRPDARAGSEEP